MNLILILIGILIVARVGGELFQRLKQPAILGELLAGACLGLFITYVPNLPEQLSGLKHNDIFLTLGDLGILFLMFLAGMQIKPRQFVNASRSGMAVAIGGVIVPLALGYGFGRMVLPDSDYVFSQSLFLGIALSITAIPVSVRVLMDLNLLNTPVGRVLVNAAAADDVIGLVLLAVLTATLGHDGSGGGTDIVLTFLKVAGFLVFTILAGRFAMPWLAEKLRHMKSTEAEFTIALVFALLISTAAEFAGLHYAIGAFIAGLFVNQISSNRQVFRNLENTTSAIALGFLAPFFFVSLGLSIDFSAIGASPLLIVGVVLIAIIGKLLGRDMLLVALDRVE